MAGITSEGLVIKTLPEILQSMSAKLQARYGSSFSTAINTPEGVIINIAADELSDLWEGLQGVYDAAYPKTSFDTNLDNVADLVGVKRIGNSKSNGNVEFTGNVGSVIPEGSVVLVDTTESRFVTTSELTLLSSVFSNILIQVSSVVDSTDYTVTIDGNGYTFNSGVGATAASILNGLVGVINTNLDEVLATLPTTTTININVIEPDSTLPIVVGARLSILKISNVVAVEAEDSGQVQAPIGTLNSLLVPVVGVDSVTNLKEVETGRVRESDEEFRVRRYESVNIVGATTFGALTARVRNITGVTSAFLIENDTSSVDAEGRPAKSFEAVVDGGDLDEIAETIWKYKPVGIETFGSITRTILDEDGEPRTVSFSRPVDVYIHVQVQYSRYIEEPFSATAIQGIKDAVVSYGNTLNIGTDIIPQRFYGAIYNSVTGLGDLVVRVAKSYDGITPVTPYQTTTLPISRKESPTFLNNIVFVSEV